MPSLLTKLSSLGKVQAIDDYTFKVNDIEIIVNQTKPGFKYLVLGKEPIGFKKQTDLMKYLDPNYGRKYAGIDDYPGHFIATELKEMQYDKREEYRTHCYNETLAIELTKRFKATGKFKSVDWYYDIMKKCYIVEGIKRREL